jgi:hypothetical protein
MLGWRNDSSAGRVTRLVTMVVVRLHEGSLSHSRMSRCEQVLLFTVQGT